MSDVIISPNMSLPVPIVGVDPGPEWANDLNACLGILDQHDHSAGKGVPITPNGLDINSDLSIGGNNLTQVKTVNFTAQLAPLAGLAPNLGCIYVAGNELYYNDEAGNVVAITNNGSVNAGAGSITGLPSGTASASYSSGSQTFIWQSATSTPANMDFASAIFRNLVANSKGLTLNPPAAMGADFSLTLPSLPGANSFMTLDSVGNMGTTLTTALANSVATTMDANGANAVANSRTRSTGTTVGAGGVAVSVPFSGASAGVGPITGLTVTITTTGRPVQLIMQCPDGPTTTGFVQITASGVNSQIIQFVRGSTQIASYISDLTTSSGAISYPSSAFYHLDMGVNGSPGTYTYSMFINAPAAVNFGDTVLVAYEI